MQELWNSSKGITYVEYNWNTKRRRKNNREDIFEIIMSVNFPKLMTDTKPQIQEVQRTAGRKKYEKSTYRCWQKIKRKNHRMWFIQFSEKFGKSDEESMSQIICQGSPMSSRIRAVTVWLRVTPEMSGFLMNTVMNLRTQKLR